MALLLDMTNKFIYAYYKIFKFSLTYSFKSLLDIRLKSNIKKIFTMRLLVNIIL